MGIWLYRLAGICHQARKWIPPTGMAYNDAGVLTRNLMKDYLKYVTRKEELVPLRWHWYEFWVAVAATTVVAVLIHSL